MAFFQNKEEEVVLCSPMEGRITLNGTPAAGARLERLVTWKDDVGERDYATTDKEGYFSFPVKIANVSLNAVSQFVMAQEISVFYDNNEYIIWSIGKRSRQIYGELNGKPVNFRCELSDEETPVRLNNSLLMTSCKWDSVIPQEEKEKEK